MFELSPIDYYFLRPNLYTMKFAFEFTERIDFKKLKLCFQQLQERENILSSTLHLSDQARVFLAPQKLQSHQVLVYNEFNQELSDVALRELFLSVENRAKEFLLKIKYISTPKRNFLLVTMSHLLGDGRTLFLILEALSQLYNGQAPHPFSHQRESLISLAKQTPNVPLTDQEFFESTGYKVKPIIRYDKSTIERLNIDKNEIRSLKKEFSRNGLAVTEHIILMALVAKRYGHKIDEADHTQFIIRCSVDYRKLLGLDDSFFGNAVCDAYTTFEREELLHTDLPSLAKKIKRSIQAIDKDYVQNFLSTIHRLQTQRGFEVFENVSCPGLVVSNLSKMPLQKLSFSGQAPMRMIYGSLPANFAAVFPKENFSIPLFFNEVS